MDRQKFEQSCAIKFCVKLGESATVTYEKLQRAYEEHSLSRAQVFRWHKSFLEGREQVEDEPRAERLSTSKTDDNVERVRSLVRSDRRKWADKFCLHCNIFIYIRHIWKRSHKKRTRDLCNTRRETQIQTKLD